MRRLGPTAPLIGLLALLAAGACSGLFAVLVRELADALSGHQQVFLRQSFAVVFVLAALSIGGRARARRTRSLRAAPVVGFAVAYVAGAPGARARLPRRGRPPARSASSSRSCC